MDINNSLDVHLRRLRTTNIPTILVEGKDDFLLLDWILAKSNANTSNILVCGGSLMLHKIFETDTLVTRNFSAIPVKYGNIICGIFVT